MIKRIVLALLTAFAVSALVGCESDGRVHDKNYLRAVSVSGSGEKSVTFTFFTKDGKYLTVSGRDISEAKNLAEIKTGRKIFTGYTELILTDGGNTTETLEFMLHKWKVSPSCIVAYAGESAEKIFSGNTVERLSGSVRMAVKQGKSPECDIITVLAELLGSEKKAEIAEITAEGFTAVHTLN